MDNGWISIKDRLPVERNLYIIAYEINGNRYVATSWFFPNKGWETGVDVISWQPLPPPPESD